MPVLVCFALKEEAAPFRKIMAGGAGHGGLVFVVLTGIGRENAARSVREFLDAGSRAPGVPLLAFRRKHLCTTSKGGGTPALPEVVLTCGFAGGLNPELKLGDVVSDFGNPSSELGIKLAAAGAKPAKFLCAEHVAVTAAEKKQLREQTGADAVEMESAAIHTVCAERGIPCVTVRVISDTAHEDLPLDFNALAKPDRNLDYGKVLLAIAKSPQKIGALIKLQKQTRFAAQRLAEVLRKLF